MKKKNGFIISTTLYSIFGIMMITVFYILYIMINNRMLVTTSVSEVKEELHAIKSMVYQIELGYSTSEAKYNTTTNQISLNASSSLYFNLNITNPTDSEIKYKMYYKMISPVNIPNGLDVGISIMSNEDPTGNISALGQKTIRVGLRNESSSNITIEVAALAKKTTGNISLKEGQIAMSYISENQPPTNFVYTGSYQTYTAPIEGDYILEVWGAQGGGISKSGNTNSGDGGKGGYSKGTIHLTKGQTLYVYVGGQGNSSSTGLASGGWNGGGSAYATSSSEPGNGGGGATDIRYAAYSDPLNTTSLNQRIIVAGGGGGGGEDGGETGGAGGGTSGTSSYPGTQSSSTGGGAFGIGAHTSYDGGAGGGGWYGGGTSGGSQTIPTANSTSDTSATASGGSGYVLTSSSTKPSGYAPSSSYYLTDASTTAGNVSIPSTTGSTETGHAGDGYARITPLNNGTLSQKILTDNNPVKTGPSFTNSHTNNGLYVQQGDSNKSISGQPTYYFRGDVTNNFISFANNVWRIVRINEDGTIKLILNSAAAQTVYNSGGTTLYNGSTIKSLADSWYNNNIGNNINYSSKIAKGNFCNDTTNTATSRMPSPSFVCPSGANNLSLNVGIISADEAIYAGSNLNSYPPTYLGIGLWFWTMTSADSNNMLLFIASSAGTGGIWNHTSAVNNQTRDLRPVINLKANIAVKHGTGTSNDPYIIE